MLSTADLIKARKTLKQLQDYLEPPNDGRFAGKDCVGVHSAISMVEHTMERLKVAKFAS
jgi:hypothetical protein